MKKVTTVLHTNGSGLWSKVQTSVKVVALDVDVLEDYTGDDDFGELVVIFDKSTWNTDEHGLIYTDKLFLSELKDFLTSLHLDSSDVEYSEQGMQGRDYVSLDVGKEFLDSWKKRFN